MKIYVGNLPFSTTEQEVNDLFAEYGAVASVAIINDRDTGRSRGFGFVEVADERRSPQGHRGARLQGLRRPPPHRQRSATEDQSLVTDRDSSSESSKDAPDERQSAGGGTFTRCPQCSMTVRRNSA